MGLQSIEQAVAPSGAEAAAWAWRAPPDAMFDRIVSLASSWSPAPTLSIGAEELRHALAHAARNRAHWLLHPLVFAVGIEDDSSEIRQARDFQLALWLAAHGSLAANTIVADRAIWVWGEGGSFKVEAGRHDLSRLLEDVVDPRGGRQVFLDVWCHTHRLNVVGGWASNLVDLSDADEAALLAASRTFFQAIGLATQVLPECLDWVLEGARIVIPLRSLQDGTFNSRSSPDFPGLIEMDLLDGGVMEVLEAMVHETAHHYLYRAEATAPLIDSSHVGLHHSPLRKEPRPLRGIFLAWHALAFICLMYKQAAARDLFPAQARAELSKLRRLLDEGEEVMSAEREALTAHGKEFYRRTAMVADLARQ